MNSVMDRVEKLLEGRKWSSTRLGDTTVRTSFRVGGGATVPLVITFEKTWVKLAVIPLGRLPAEATRAEQLYKSLLEWNGEIRMARFSLDEDGDVLLSAEIPTGEATDSLLSDALDSLAYYADRHASEIKSLLN
ncbi:MAG: YbjN domain-containing protein [Deltaproteobacteria bacterium]|nr:YbjN domain-containing protein [Deltaproteobacteria bacterium]